MDLVHQIAGVGGMRGQGQGHIPEAAGIREDLGHDHAAEGQGHVIVDLVPGDHVLILGRGQGRGSHVQGRGNLIQGK